MFFSAFIYHLDGAFKCIFSNCAGLLGVSHYLIVKDREVEGKAEAHRVERQDATVLSIAKLK